MVIPITDIMKLKLICFSYILLLTLNIFGQDPLDDLLNDMESSGQNITTNTFKSSRILIGHSIEQPAKGEMDFRISHRFGRLNNGFYEIWGLDDATIHFSFEYSIYDWLTAGVGRSNWQKTYDGYLKIALLRQQKGTRNIPFSVSYFVSNESITLRNEIDNYEWFHRMSYTHQILVAHKFNKRVSLQFTPSYVHRNLVKTTLIKNDLLAMGFGGRFKITNRLSFNAETFFIYDKGSQENTDYYNPLSFGIDLETGGHVFQIFFTNALPMREAAFIGNTTGNWADGDIHLGFNISRMFNIINK
jgi:hypothetical protein